MLTGERLAAVGASSLAVLVWAEDGWPRCHGVLALVDEDRPVVAFKYADADTARSVAASPEVLLAAVEPRGTGSAFAPLLLRARPQLEEDPTGETFGARLLDQELRRFPPARVLADSPLLRREHWWYLPRLLVGLDVVADEWPSRAPSGPAAALLAVLTAEGLALAEATGADESEAAGDTVLLDSPDTLPGPGPAELFVQDASFPDLERWSQWRHRGHWDGLLLHVDEGPGETGLAPAPGLVRRWRRQRELEHRCRDGLADGGRTRGQEGTR